MLKRIKNSVIKTLGRTSQGIDLCFEFGATSGNVSDYIYQNQPRGKWGIGKFIDRLFLRDPSSEGVRFRRVHLEEFITEAIYDLQAEGKPAHLMDMACGTASYILSVLEKIEGGCVTACCRDIDERWLFEGAKEAARRQLSAVTFEKGDAFDCNSLLTHRPRPNLVVLSGFYDWISDDAKVVESMDIVHQVLDSDGYFIVSHQMTQSNIYALPQTVTLTLRSKETILHWLEEEGFVVEKTLCDPNGYYSVTKARKI